MEEKKRFGGEQEFTNFLGKFSHEFTDGVHVISAKVSKEDFYKDLVGNDIIEEDDPDTTKEEILKYLIKEDRVAFSEDEDDMNFDGPARYLGAKGKKGAYKVWTYGN